MKNDFNTYTNKTQQGQETQLSHFHPLKKRCTKFLSRHQPLSVRQWLSKMANSKYCDYEPDFYGTGKLIAALEERMAQLLGKPNAIFCNKGMVGQLSAIKHWTNIKGNDRIAFQPDCHLDFDEQSSYSKLLNLQSTLIGCNKRPLQAEDFSIASPESPLSTVSVLSIELPHRRAGFLLPEWQTLFKLKDYCAETSTALHFDGARLFESAPYWEKTPAQVCTLCDSVYVSLYKLFGALAGGVVAADEETIEAIKPWKSRMAGDVHTMFPNVITAMMGLDEYLPRINEFRERARHIASIATSVFGHDAIPHQIQSNNFVLHLPMSNQKANQIALDIAEKEQKWLFDAVYDAPENRSKVEIQIGDALDALSDAEIEACFQKFT